MSQTGLTGPPIFEQLDEKYGLGNTLLSYVLSAEAFVYGALLFYVLGFMFRDELWLRGLLFVGTLFYILYYYYVSDTPLWEAMFTSGILAAVNLVMIVVVTSERSTWGMSGEMAELYGFFKNLSPGQFRRIMKQGELITADKDRTLAVEGEALDKFYFVFEGQATITKRDVSACVPAGHFIGEVAFLKGGAATATAQVSKDSRYLEWDQADLKRLMKKSPNLSNGLLALLNMDMAGKVGRSQPVSE